MNMNSIRSLIENHVDYCRIFSLFHQWMIYDYSFENYRIEYGTNIKYNVMNGTI